MLPSTMICGLGCGEDRRGYLVKYDLIGTGHYLEEIIWKFQFETSGTDHLVTLKLSISRTLKFQVLVETDNLRSPESRLFRIAKQRPTHIETAIQSEIGELHRVRSAYDTGEQRADVPEHCWLLRLPSGP